MKLKNVLWVLGLGLVVVALVAGPATSEQVGGNLGTAADGAWEGIKAFFGAFDDDPP